MGSEMCIRDRDENLKVEKLLEFLEDLEDVQNVFSNQTLGRT